MEGHCSTGQSPQWAAMPMEEEEEEDKEEEEEDTVWLGYKDFIPSANISHMYIYSLRR